MAEFLRQQILGEHSSTDTIIKGLDAILCECDEHSSVTKAIKKQFEDHWYQLKEEKWNTNIHWFLAASGELREALDVCESNLKIMGRYGKVLGKATNLTRRLGSEKVKRNKKIRELMEEVDLYKRNFPTKLKWQSELEKHWQGKYPDLNLPPSQTIHEYMALIVGDSSPTRIINQLHRADFRLT